MHIFKLGATHHLNEIYDLDELRRAADSVFEMSTSSFFSIDSLRF
jgi:hypothetical protein